MTPAEFVNTANAIEEHAHMLSVLGVEVNLIDAYLMRAYTEAGIELIHDDVMPDRKHVCKLLGPKARPAVDPIWINSTDYSWYIRREDLRPHDKTFPFDCYRYEVCWYASHRATG